MRGLRSELVVGCTRDLIDPPAAEPAVPLVSVWSAERQDETATISSLQYTGVRSVAINVASEHSISVAQCFFCKTIFSGTRILIFDWRPQYSTSLRQ